MGNDISENSTSVNEIHPQSVKKNFGYQTLYQIFILVIPFITAPFMTRRLGAESLGNFTYANSIASYFCLFAALGIATHGVRAIAASRNDPIKLRKTFWSLYLVHSISGLIALFSYFIFLFFVSDNQKIYYIETLSVVSALFDITWLFSGLENFRSVILKNLVVKIITAILLLTLISRPEDIYIYTWIQAGSALASQILLIPWAIKHIKPIAVSLGDCLAHIKPLLVLFISSIAFTLYTVFDRTLLGLMTTKEDVAYYSYSDSIISIPKAIIGTLITVIYPRVCALFSKGEIEESKRYVHISLEFVSLLGMGTMFGLLCIGPELAIVYFGNDFAKTGTMLQWMSPLPYIITVGQIAIFEYMVPSKKDTLITINDCITAVVNVGLSALLVHFMGANGAILGTIVAELLLTILNVFSTKGFVSFKNVLLAMIPYAFIGSIMYVCLFFIQKYWAVSVLQLIVLIISGLVIYLLLSSLYLFFISRNKQDNRKLFKQILHLK
jgi:O-antigen/teichoic acid export membrane protein